MKKFSKILIVALTLAVLLCSAFAISASAEETDGAVAASEDGGKWVISKNVSYSENIHLLLAIDASKVEDSELLSVKISVPGVDAACEEFLRCEFKEDLYGEYDEGAVPAYIIHTLGVAAKDMADELTIEIVYNGATVETTTYSVAEYFFERLYKDEFILATDGEALNKKELYLASLKYGNAAQKLLSAADALYIEDAIYVRSDVESVPVIFDSREFLTLDNGYYNVKSYVDGEVVNSVVAGGNYLIKNPAVITKMNIKEAEYVIPENTLTFDSAEATDFGSPAKANTAESLGLFGGNVANVQQYTQSLTNAPVTSALVKDGTNGYLSTTKGKIDNGDGTFSPPTTQNWTIFSRDTSTVAGDTLTIDMRLRYSYSNAGSGTNALEFRLYTSSSTALTNQSVEFGASARMYLPINSGKYEICTSKAANDFNSSTSTILNCTTAGDWMTVRITYALDGTLTLYVLNETGSIVSNNGEEYQNNCFVPYYTEKYAAVTSLDDIKTFRLMPSSAAACTYDVDYVYFGSELSFPELEVPELSGVSGVIIGTDESAYGQASYANLENDVNGNGAYDDGDTLASPSSIKAYDENGNPVPQWKGSVVIYKDILTNDVYGYMDDTHAGSDYNSGKASESDAKNLDIGQGQLNFYTSEVFDTKIVVEADLKLDKSSLGTYSSGNLFRLQINKKNVMGLRFYNNGGKIAWTAEGGATTTAEFGEWFHVRYEYVYTPAAGDVAASATATVIVTDIRGEVTSLTYTCGSSTTIDPSAYAVRASVVPSKGYQSLFYTRNVIITNE
ncbi:MAG: hypothetical protein IJE25_04730 [Clostridia bacterium]|nr:hypothetical protein [Clostridia bacterium]